jgi:hypothetical protein
VSAAAYYGTLGHPTDLKEVICHFRHFDFCGLPHPPSGQPDYAKQLEGYFQAIFVTLLTVQAFLVHNIKQPSSSDLQQDHPIQPGPPKSKEKISKRIVNFLRSSRFCVVVLLIIPAIIFSAATINKGEQGVAVFVIPLVATYASLLTWLAFQVHDFKQLSSSSFQPSEPPKSKQKISSRIVNFLTVPAFCVWVLLIIPTLVFVAAIINQGEQDLAIFVLALAAIYVAAEHYSSLERQGNIVRRQELATDKLEWQLGSLSNALGTPYSQKVIFKAYAKTASETVQPGIYAIYKYPDIDSKWWSSDVKNVWAKYFSIQGETLFYSVRKGKRKKILFVVTEVPLSLKGKAGDGGLSFSKFIGIAWYWICLDEAAKNDPNAEYDIMVANTSNWVHVVDNQVYQLIGTPPDNLRVRDLNFDTNMIAYGKGKRVDGAEEAGKNLVKWAITNIVRFAERGVPAEEHLHSVLMRLLIEKGWGGDHDIDLQGMKGLLDDLGLQAWLEGKLCNCPPKLVKKAPDLCASILYEFMKRHRQQHNSHSADNPKPTDIALELQ